MSKAEASLERLAWDDAGLRLRFRHYFPTMDGRDRDRLVSACLHASEFGTTAEDFFGQMKRQLEGGRKKRR